MEKKKDFRGYCLRLMSFNIKINGTRGVLLPLNFSIRILLARQPTSTTVAIKKARMKWAMFKRLLTRENASRKVVFTKQ